MDERRGVFIVIEGADGSGKTTQFKRIKERLEADGYPVETFDFPQYDKPSSYFIRRYLNGDYGGLDEVGPYTSSLFYALDRFEAASGIREALRAGKIVISNRFTGSSMAHQGTKIVNAEQRRGFFIWLDNLEFEMLRIPRPDISFILRVPANIAQELVGQKGERNYTDKTHDLHEADLEHLKKTTDVYDDMTQLFPKDFQRIDCVRAGHLLDVETVSAMLWEKIRPLLPEPPAPAAKNSPSAVAAAPAAAPNEPAPTVTSEEPAKVGQLLIENASGLLIQKVEQYIPEATATYADIPSIYVPNNLVPEAARAYEADTKELLNSYAKMVGNLAKRGASAEEARAAARPLLPIAATAHVHIHVDSPGLDALIVELLNDSLPEAQAAGAQLLAQAIQIAPGRFKGTGKPLSRTGPMAVKALAAEFLVENHIGDHKPLELVAIWPRNELDLVADMLYVHTSLPLRTIQDRVLSWPMSRKLAVMEAYLGNGEPGPVLEKAHYSWDFLGSYENFRELQRHASENLATQALTPRYGYGIPPLVEEAELSEQFEACFDLSLKLYSTLQQAGHHDEAQYVTLHGHNQRWQMTMNARQLLELFKAGSTPSTQKLLGLMREKLAEYHPTIIDSIVTSA